MARIVDLAWSGLKSKNRGHWLTQRREDLGDGDLLTVTSNKEEDRGEKLRRITWTRYAIRDDRMIIAPIHLATGDGYLDEPEQVEMEATMDREVRNAILLRPPA